MRVVLANGCFDILHVGHVMHLQQARAMGDRLVVSLTEDEFVNKGPGRPIYTFNDRLLVLSALECVDSVIRCSSAVEAIRMVRPTYFVKGADYADGQHWKEDVAAACAEVGAILRFTDTPKMSATEAIRKAMA